MPRCSAFLKAPKILLFDEATSALDSKTETEILEALRALAQVGGCVKAYAAPAHAPDSSVKRGCGHTVRRGPSNLTKSPRSHASAVRTCAYVRHHTKRPLVGSLCCCFSGAAGC